MAAPPVDTTFVAGRWHRDRISHRGFWVEAKVFGKSLITAPNTDVRKFLIISTPRSGTTLLQDLLGSHPDVQCDGEVLHRKVLAPTGYLERLARKNRQPAYGAKLLSYQMVQVQRLRDPVAFLADLQQRGFRLIHLKRSTFTQTLSLALAQSTGTYHTRKTPGKRAPVVLDIEDFIRRLEWSDLLSRYERFCLRDLEHLYLSYEADLLDPDSQVKTANRVFDWIGASQHTVRSDLRKILPKDPAEILSNYEELAEAMEVRGLGHHLKL